MTKLREEEKKKRRLHDESELISAIGKRGKKGVKEAKKFFESQTKTEKEKEAAELTLLASTKKIVTYNSLLTRLLLKRLTGVEWPHGWQYRATPTANGVVMEIESPDHRFFRAAFKPTGLPKYDLNAVDIYAVRAENTVDRITGADGVIVTK